MITQTINLNMVPGSVYPVIHVSQYDNDSDALKFNLFSGNSSFTVPTGSAVVINGTKPDGYGFSYSATFSGNVVTASLTQQMTAVAGEVKCELRITKSSNVVGSQNFTLLVEPAALDENTVISDSDIPAIAAASTYAAEAAAAAAVVQAASSLTNGIPTSITSGSINDITTPGYYSLPNSGSSALVSDLPEGINGNLWVYRTLPANTSALRQIFMRIGTAGSNDNNIWVRQSNTSGVWGTWWQFIDASNLLLLNNNISITNVPTTGYLSSDSKTLSFFIPYAAFSGSTLSVTNFSAVIRHSGGGYVYLKSGTNGNTYTQIGSGATDIISNGSAKRSNEIDSTAYYTRAGSGFMITFNFKYAVCSDNAGTAVTNNTPISVMVSSCTGSVTS